MEHSESSLVRRAARRAGLLIFRPKVVATSRPGDGVGSLRHLNEGSVGSIRRRSKVRCRGSSPRLPLASRASWAKGLLLLAGAVDIVAVLTGFALYRLADKASSGTVTSEQFQAAQDRHDLVVLGQMAVYLVAGVVFIRWFYRAYANLPAVGIEGLDRRTGWAIGAWFVPIASLFWPKQIADEIWRGSDPSLEPDQSDGWRHGRVPVFLGVWWLAFIGSGLFVAAGSQLWEGAETFSQLELAAIVQVVGDLLGVLSGVLAYVVVDRTSERQQARATKLATWRALLPQT